jgi:hypothetical protein
MGRKEGYGKYIFENGKVYEGGWKDGKQHGKGKVTLKGGKVI